MKSHLFVLTVACALSACSETPTFSGAGSVPLAADGTQVSSKAALSGSVARTDFAGLVQLSVAQSPGSAAGVASIAASQSRITSERSALRPQLAAETSVNDDGDAVPILRLSQIIYDGGKTSGRVVLRQRQARQAWLTEISELSARSFAAVEAIIDLDRDRRLQRQAEENLGRIDGVMEDLQARYDAGAGSVADLLAGQGRQSNAQTELAQAQSEVEFSTANWVELFGSRPGAIPTVPKAPTLTSATTQEMVARSPRLRTQVEQSEVRAQEVVVTEQSIRPTLSAILETDFDTGNFEQAAQARVGVSVPIYRGGQVKADVETANALLEQSKADAETLRRELRRNLDQALEETSSIKGRLASAYRAVELNDEALDAARGQFELGRGTFLQILDALRELNTSEVRVIRLEAQERRAEYAILAVTGDILDALGIVQPTDPTTRVTQ